MRRSGKMFAMITFGLSLTAVSVSQPALAEGACTGLDVFCDFICFEVCTAQGCIVQTVDLYKGFTDE